MKRTRSENPIDTDNPILVLVREGFPEEKKTQWCEGFVQQESFKTGVKFHRN